jgi:predicted hotdog family 3-hydroxylacyl-ACP dehydratase
MKRNENPATEISIEELIPHRGRMKLIDDIVRVDAETAVTESVVKRDWPLSEEDSVSPLVLIELVAQTAGVCIGWEESVLKGKDIQGRLGWLVGIKQARFYLDRIPIKSRITVTSKKDFCLENYQEVVGTAEIGPRVVGEIRLQIVHPDSDEPPT